MLRPARRLFFLLCLRNALLCKIDPSAYIKLGKVIPPAVVKHGKIVSPADTKLGKIVRLLTLSSKRSSHTLRSNSAKSSAS